MRAKKSRPKVLEGKTYRIEGGCGKLHITVNEDDGRVSEVFSKIGKGGACASAMTEAICRMVSLHLRCGGEVADVIEQLEYIRCANPNTVFVDGEKVDVHSCPDGVAYVLRTYYLKETTE